MSPSPRTPCVVCGGTEWEPLPEPGPQSMASDWRIVPEPLSRFGCRGCGLARRWSTPLSGEGLYASGYGLYAHALGDARERARQESYARWIVDAVSSAPTRVLDVGCGNGSLLLALRAFWPAAALCGCDPSAESVAHGARHGLHLWRGTAADRPPGERFDLVVSVNVIEHTADPIGFIESLRRAMTDDGVLVLVCPDGARPGVEMLVVDHVFSFASGHLRTLMTRHGLRVVTEAVAPDTLGAFQMVIVTPGSALLTPPPIDDGAVSAGRAAYLERWRRLDARLAERVAGPAVCFGAGEAAGLLRAYAPETWRLVRACTLDGVPQVGATFGDLPLLPFDAVRPDDTLLVGVRPIDQPSVAERFRGRIARVVTWYDLVG